MKQFIIIFLALGMMVACSTNYKTLTIQNLEGNYVTSDYQQRTEGYDWSVVIIDALSDSTASISVRSRADIKRPTCSFEATGHLNATSDTLVADSPNGKIFFTRSGDTLSVSGQPSESLYYYCSGGASLAGDYVKLHETLDETQL